MDEKNKNSEKSNTKHHIKSHHMNGLLIIVILLSIILLFMIKPSFEHYMNNKRFKDYGENPGEILESLKNIEKELSLTKINYTSCKRTNKIITKENKKIKENLSDYQTENSRISSDLELAQKKCDNRIEEFNNSVTNTIKSYKMDVENNIKRRKEMEENFKELAKNSAKNTCCKQKVDNPNINSYSIINNKIECGNGKNKELNC
ncbi:MAG: hypothetical protein ACQER9_00410 [Nanobdellota archaeon]